MHVNYFEILAAYFGIKIFAEHLSNCQILLCMDDITAISYINCMRGIQYSHLTKVTKSLWQWYEARNLHVYAFTHKLMLNRDQYIPMLNENYRLQLFKKSSERLEHPKSTYLPEKVNRKCAKPGDTETLTVNDFTIEW